MVANGLLPGVLKGVAASMRETLSHSWETDAAALMQAADRIADLEVRLKNALEELGVRLTERDAITRAGAMPGSASTED